MSAFLALISGCSLAPEAPAPEEPPPPVETSPDIPPQPDPEPEPPAPPPGSGCEWTRTKGVAEVVAVEESEPEFRFYPGNIRVPAAPEQHIASGREFKAILVSAPGCTPKLEVVDSVP